MLSEKYRAKHDIRSVDVPVKSELRQSLFLSKIVAKPTECVRGWQTIIAKRDPRSRSSHLCHLSISSYTESTDAGDGGSHQSFRILHLYHLLKMQSIPEDTTKNRTLLCPNDLKAGLNPRQRANYRPVAFPSRELVTLNCRP